MNSVRSATAVILLATLLCPRDLNAQSGNQQASPPKSGGHHVQFSFSKAPWRTVVQWLADEGGYALHVNDLPLGSFTYSDRRSYTIDEAINRINLFLIPRRYTLVRSGELLSVVNLDDETSIRQLDAMARVVKPEQLAGLGEQDVVKCVFPLGDLTQETALEELNGLMLIREPTILKNTNQLLVLDTVKKLRMVQAAVARLSTPNAATGPVKRFSTGDLNVEDVLTQVRPHVGLDPLAMTGSDIRLSVDRDRAQILASGSPENLQAVANVIALLQHDERPSSPIEKPSFRTHDISEADLQAVVNVLLTLLADEDVSLEAIPKTSQIAVLGSEKVHGIVETTIKELTGSTDAVEFRVMPLDLVDPRYAAVVLNDMFANPAADETDVTATQDRPRIDVDTRSRRLFVRARRSQLDAIEEALSQLGIDQQGQSAGRVRLLPYHGEEAAELLDTARRFWPYTDRLEVTEPLARPSSRRIEREVQSASTNHGSSQKINGLAETMIGFDDIFVKPKAQYGQTMLVSRDQTDRRSAGEEGTLRIQITPGGILVRGDSTEAVQRFERHLKLIAGSSSNGERTQAVFYLKHAKVNNANRLLQQVLAEESISGDAFSSLLLNANVADVGGLWSFSSATVIPDKRLNRIFAFGAQNDLDRIESHLEIIDRENSITDLKTHGAPRVVVLQHARAEIVAGVIRDAYAGRIASNAQERMQVVSASTQKRSSDDKTQLDSGGDSQSDSWQRPPSSDETKMTLAVDAEANAIVITAPNQLAEQVESLAKQIDRESVKTVMVLSVKGINSRQVQQILQQMFGDQISSGPKVSASNRR